MRRAAKVDANHQEIAWGFKQLGCSVQSLANIGKGVPDLLVSRRGITWLVEVKQPKGKETPDQVEWSGKWQGRRAIARTLNDVADVVRDMNVQANRLREVDVS